MLDECGGITRNSEYQDSIKDFKESIQQAGIEPFLKIHLLDHVADFLEAMDEISPTSNPGLSWTSEQAIESSHHHFAETWIRYKKAPGKNIKKKARSSY